MSVPLLYCKPILNCSQCISYDKTPLNIQTLIARCETVQANLCGQRSTHGNGDCLNKEIVCSPSINDTSGDSSTYFQCECLMTYAYNMKGEKCEHVYKDLIWAHLVLWLMFLPIAIFALILGFRLYCKKLKDFQKRNKLPTHGKCLCARKSKHYCCGTRILFVIWCMILFMIRRIYKCISMENLYFGRFLGDIYDAFWWFPTFAAIILVDLYGSLQNKLLNPQRRQKKEKNLKAFVIFLVAVTIGCVIFEFICVFSPFLGIDEQRMSFILQQYIRNLLTPGFVIVLGMSVAFYAFRLVKLMKKLQPKGPEIKVVNRSTLRNIERLNVMSFYIFGILFYIIFFSFILFMSTAVDYVEPVGFVYYFGAFTSCDVLLMILVIRLIEAKAKSDVVPILSIFRCCNLKNIFISTKSFTAKVAKARNSVQLAMGLSRGTSRGIENENCSNDPDKMFEMFTEDEEEDTAEKDSESSFPKEMENPLKK